MPQQVVYLSGEYLPQSEAKVSIFDAAVTMGYTITESTRTFRHRPFRLRDHIDRLFLGLKVCRLDCGMTPSELEQRSLEVWEKNRPCYKEDEDAWIIHNITPGAWVPSSGQMPADVTPTVMILTLKLDLTYWANFYLHGAHAVTPWTRVQPAQCLDPRIKNRSRMLYSLAEKEVKLVDPMAQSVLLDVDGNVTENKGGNFFIVTHGKLRTARASVLEGISRKTVLELADKLSIPSEECNLKPYDVITAEEAFFTSTPYCMFPATEFNGIPIGGGKVGPVTKKLLSAWSDLVGLDIAQQALGQMKGGAGKTRPDASGPRP